MLKERLAAIVTALLLLTSLASAANVAQAAGALDIVAPKNGASVRSPVTVVIHFAAAEGSEHPPHEHAHLIVDAPLPAPGTMIPMDAHHLHLMQGETKETLELPPGTHTLQLIVTGHDHRVPAHTAQSARVTIRVH